MPERLARRVLLVGWDAADWKTITPLLDAGALPSLQGLIDRGVMGNLATLEPMLSPMLWTSIATGKRADRHGILGFVEPDPDTGAIRPVASTSRRSKALWNILTQRGLKSGVVGWFASHPAEPIDGVCVSNFYPHAGKPPHEPWPLPPGCVHPPELAETLAELRLHPAELTDAHLLPFVPLAARIDQRKDYRLAVLARQIAEATSVHAAATWIMEHRDWDFLAVYYEFIDLIGHHFMPYHPPRRAGVSEADFELYKDVMAGAYRYSDMMLGRLLQLAGDDTTVLLVSDHGFHSDHLRPDRPAGFGKAAQPVSWHRPLGVLAMSGPHVRRDERIYGAHLLDIAPTVLTLFGLPVGDDMEGRPLRAAFDHPIAVESIPSWEAEPGPCGQHPPGLRADPWEAREALRQLVELGYIEAPGADREAAARRLDRDRRGNLARVHLDAGRPAEAAPLLEALLAEDDSDPALALAVARCRLALGDLEGCRRLLEPPAARDDVAPGRDLLLGRLALAEGRTDDALAHCLRAEAAQPRLPNLHVQIGTVYLRQNRPDDAERAFRLALEIDGDSPTAHHGLAVAHLRRKRFEDAADAALTAVGLLHNQPLAHYHLGVALAHLREPVRAVQALEISLTLNPRLADAHRWLAAIHARALRDPARAAEHRRQADALAPR